MDYMLKPDMKAILQIMENEKNKYGYARVWRHDALHKPEINPDECIRSIVNVHNQQYPAELRTNVEKAVAKMEEQRRLLEHIKQQIDENKAQYQQYAEEAKSVKRQLDEAIKFLQAMLPEAARQDVLDNFNSQDLLLRHLKSGMNAVVWFFQKRKYLTEFQSRYEKVKELIDKETKIKARLIDLKGDGIRLEDKAQVLQAQLSEVPRCIIEHNSLQDIMYQEIAKFLLAYENRAVLRKQIPATLNMRHLEKPVAFFQTITGMEQKEVEALLVHAGLPVVGQDERQYEDTGGYIVRRTVNINGRSCLELITPFYSPQHARKNIECLVHYLAEHGAEFEGVVAPATYEQINPAGKTEWSNRRETNALKCLIWRKLEGRDVMSRSQFCNLYKQNDVQATPEYLFRGHTFITSDPQSSYATPTWRTGRTGLVYAASDPSKAATYASNSDGQQVAGMTMSTESMVQIDGHAVGFVTVFKGSKRNLMFGDRTLEEVKVNKELKAHLSRHVSVRETVVSPVDNPVIARYMVVGDKMLLIDENDKDWRMIMDGMAPDLEQTHVRGIPQKFRSGEQELHGLGFLRRIRRWQQEINENGQVTTYDIPSAGIKAMGFHSPAGQYKDATKQLADRLSCTVSMGDCVAQKTIE